MANPPPPRMPAPPPKQTAPWRLKVGKVPPWLYAVFVLGGLLQVFLAGWGIENLGAQGMEEHAVFGGIVLHLIPFVILVTGFVGADWRAGVGGVVLTVLYELQYAFIEGLNAIVLALHAFNGVLMIVIAMAFLARRLPWAKAAASAPPAKPQPGVAKGPLRPGPPPS